MEIDKIMQFKPADRKKAITKVAGRGFVMNPATRVVPNRSKDRRRPKTRELLQDAERRD